MLLAEKEEEEERKRKEEEEEKEKRMEKEEEEDESDNVDESGEGAPDDKYDLYDRWNNIPHYTRGVGELDFYGMPPPN